MKELEHALSRRTVLASFGLTAVGVAVGVSAPSPALADATSSRQPKQTTQNGWPVADRAQVRLFRIEGCDASVKLLPGAVAAVLIYVARRFNYEVALITKNDVHGFADERDVVSGLESNYPSGTAISIAPMLYPAGSIGNLFYQQMLVVRDILAECEGVVRWGGDSADSPREGHFQIDVPPNAPALTRVASKIGSWNTRPGLGAGAIVDPLINSRRAAATALEAKQRHS